jgi:hypothetical protein
MVEFIIRTEAKISIFKKTELRVAGQNDSMVFNFEEDHTLKTCNVH